jgi:dTDP-4-dehydrorhamnose reductase
VPEARHWHDNTSRNLQREEVGLVRLLVTGAAGQLAQDIVRAFSGWDVIALTRSELDITRPEEISARLETIAPDVVINTAAYHQVDLCESMPEESFLVNAAAPQRLAAAAHRQNALLVHFSTDYVFDGRRSTPYTEEDRVHPLSVYGASKVAGEMAIRATTDRHLIIRTTGLYGHGGRTTGRGNFVETMLRLAQGGRPIQVVGDQVLTPSFTEDVAGAVRQLIEREARGTVHVTNSGACSWYEFAAEIFRLAGVRADLTPTTQSERPAPARRPAYSVLAHAGLLRHGVAEPRPWQEALEEYLAGR